MNAAQQDSLNDLRLKRILQLNERLKEELNRERIHSSEAAEALINYAQETRDYAVSCVWGPLQSEYDPFLKQGTSGKTHGKLHGAENTGCCVIC
ncbi:heterotrimeric G-protein gamma subunit (G-gamma, Gpg) [Nadsonia fulvescens var. elongata DSM 6958]|uniref:Guanine nucleotide-binding protein subunit gamma n=1 Tax=Nadsonia fulvescens var. elongata DSM 6958 TaxID=857566 RepID=A0A1E3PP75_9ASCO|nr:heterotrimeric G-protein gamma subunit (G-gamma, Gpg) [Nadsonia fulvescens var. elongata DSM 6958]